MNEYSNRSSEKLNSCHRDLQLIFKQAIQWSKVDFGISEGHRSVDRQRRLYAVGRTEELHKKPITFVDGIIKKSKHNKIPSDALDIYSYVSDKNMLKKIMYDPNHLSYIAGVVDSAAEYLFSLGRITHKIRWGGNWDGDGIIKEDQSFDDLPHFELKKPI